jgi:hypothetical protein
MSKEVLGQVATETSAGGVWCAILVMPVSQSRARIVHPCSKLASMHKGDATSIAYYSQMKGFADEMVVASKRLDDEEIICYILVGLDIGFNPFVEAFTAKTNPQTLNNLYSQLLTVEARVESQKEHQQINVIAAYRGGRGGGGRGYTRGRGDGNFYGGRGGGRGRGRSNKIPCQVCGKTRHSTLRCYKHFDASYNGEEKQVHAATTSYNVDTD